MMCSFGCSGPPPWTSWRAIRRGAIIVWAVLGRTRMLSANTSECTLGTMTRRHFAGYLSSRQRPTFGTPSFRTGRSRKSVFTMAVRQNDPFREAVSSRGISKACLCDGLEPNGLMGVIRNAFDTASPADEIRPNDFGL